MYRILDRKHWYETNNGWIEGAYNDKTNKIPQTRGLMYCLSGIPTRSKVLKLHFMEVVKKGWFRNATVSNYYKISILYSHSFFK